MTSQRCLFELRIKACDQGVGQPLSFSFAPNIFAALANHLLCGDHNHHQHHLLHHSH